MASRLCTLNLTRTPHQNDTSRRFHVESYRAIPSDASSEQSVAQMRCYFVEECDYPEGWAQSVACDDVNLEHVASRAFLESATENTMHVYQRSVCTSPTALVLLCVPLMHSLVCCIRSS